MNGAGDGTYHDVLAKWVLEVPIALYLYITPLKMGYAIEDPRTSGPLIHRDLCTVVV